MEPNIKQDSQNRSYDKNARLVILDVILKEMGSSIELAFTSADVIFWMKQNGNDINWSKSKEKIIYMRLNRLYKNKYLKRKIAGGKDKWEGFPESCKYIYIVDEKLKGKIIRYLQKHELLMQKQKEAQTKQTKVVHTYERDVYLGEIK